MRRTVFAATLFLALAACGKKLPVATNTLPTPPPSSTATTTQSTPRQAATTTTPPQRSAPTPTVSDDRKIQDALKNLNDLLGDAFFDYDKFNLRDDAVKSLTADAGVLRDALSQDRRITLTVEGHCDERGSAEYNTALGDKRATEAKQLLVQLGLPDTRIKTISFGAERPVCTDASENCWQKNRRAHVTYARN